MINLANRDNGLGLVTNIVLAVSLAALGNAIIYSQGWDRSAGNAIQPSFAPPGYVVVAACKHNHLGLQTS